MRIRITFGGNRREVGRLLPRFFDALCCHGRTRFGLSSPNFLSPVILLAGVAVFLWPLGGNAIAATDGLVIYKDHPFDDDSQAEIKNYSSIKHFAAVDNVFTTSGQALRILPSQEPVYIPQPGDPDCTVNEATRRILAAEGRFPQFAPNLEVLRRGWAALPKAAVPVATPVRGSVNELQTKSGDVFQSWTVSAIDGETVTISHSAGISRVSIADLPTAIINGNAALKQAWIAAQSEIKAAAAAKANASTSAPASETSSIYNAEAQHIPSDGVAKL